MSQQDLQEVVCEGHSSMEKESTSQSAPMLHPHVHPHSWQRIDLQSSVDDEITEDAVDEGLEAAADLDRRTRWRYILATVSVVCITTIVCFLLLGNIIIAAGNEEDNSANGKLHLTIA